MFKNLRTSTKFFVLCSMFMISIGVATYSLFAEKQLAVDFARKELIGTGYLATVRGIYAAISTDLASNPSGGQEAMSTREAVKVLAKAQATAAPMLQTAGLEQALAAVLGELGAGKAGEGHRDALILDALVAARSLAARIGDDSNLTLDPDLDTYYVQDIVVGKLPTLLGQLGEAQILFRGAPGAGAPLNDHNIRIVILDGLLRSNLEAIAANLTAAYRGNADGRLKRAVDAEIRTMISSAGSYLGGLKATTSDGQGTGNDIASLDRAYASAVESAINAWAVTQAELDRLLQQRIGDLFGKLRRSLMLIGTAACLSILIAVMTHRHIVRPLERLENVARTVHETKDYSLRMDQGGRDEIGRLAVAFNEMLAELAKAREREVAEQAHAAAMRSELARVARLTTVGEMAAMIAHEINQPLAAIVANGNAGLRWLKGQTPDLAEAQATLGAIVKDGHRAGEIIGSIRAMLKETAQTKVPLDINELIREVLALTHGELRNHGVRLQTELTVELPLVLADRIQLQQVILNLVVNAAEAMGAVTDRARILRVSSEINDPASVLLTVEDSGTGIDPKDMDRIFDTFFTTKSHGMGMGLSICRSIIESHGGSLSASSGDPHGSVFRAVLPTAGSGAS
jgi:signal transduction histidine kinase